MNSLALPEGQAALLQSVAAANPNGTVLVLVHGGPLDVSEWSAPGSGVRAILDAHYGGERGGDAIARALLETIPPRAGSRHRVP